VLLSAAEGAPLTALALADTDVVERRQAVFAEFSDVLKGQRDPVVLAERWQSPFREEFIDWMLSWVADLMRLASAPGFRELRNPDLAEGLQKLANRLNRERLSGYWDVLLQARRALSGQANRQLLLEEVLIQWSRLGGRQA
jgi:DNA polymerase-3 subunit delta'